MHGSLVCGLAGWKSNVYTTRNVLMFVWLTKMLFVGDGVRGGAIDGS